MKKIVLTGGGTAGHIYPALAIKDRLDRDWQVHYIGSGGMEKQILANEKDVTFYQIPAVKLERKFTAKNLLIPFKLVLAIKQAKSILREIKPNIIFSKGGFVALPVVLAAKKLDIPVVSHESDLTFGLANKIILKNCTIMCTTFKQTANKKNCIYTGQPLRKKIFQGKKENIENLFDFDKQKPNLLVIGGSLGSKFINEKIWQNLDGLTKKFNVVHIAGKGFNAQIKHKNYLQVEYAKNIEDFFAFADFAISRAGSGVINELLALKIPALLIPLSKACSRGDQIENAKLFYKEGICQMLQEEEFSDEKMFEKLDNLVKNAQNFKKNMKKTQNFDSCDKIVEILQKLQKENPLA